MNQFGAGRRCVLRQIILLAQDDIKPPARGVTRDPRAVDPAADHENVVHLSLSSGLRP